MSTILSVYNSKIRPRKQNLKKAKIDEIESCVDISAITGKNLTELKKLLEERFYGISKIIYGKLLL